MLPMSTSDTLARPSRAPASATIELEVAELVALAEVVGVTKAPTSANFWVMTPANGARILVSSIRLLMDCRLPFALSTWARARAMSSLRKPACSSSSWDWVAWTFSWAARYWAALASKATRPRAPASNSFLLLV